MRWELGFLVSWAILAALASLVALAGFFMVPSDALIPIHAGTQGFDGFASRTSGLITLSVVPPLVTGVLFLAYIACSGSAIAKVVLLVTGTGTTVLLLGFNIRALQYGMAAGG